MNPAERYRRNHPTTPTYGSGYQSPPEPKPNRDYNILGGRKPSLFQKIKLTLAIRAILMKKSSWKTTLGGIIALIGPVLPQILPAEWAWVGQAVTSIGVAFGLISARDNGVTSEDVGAK